MIKKTWIYLIAATVLLTITALLVFCKRDTIESSPIPIKRYEIELMQIDTTRVGDELRRLYSEGFKFLLDGIDLDDEDVHQHFFDFATDTLSKALLDAVLEKYPNLDHFEEILGKSFALYDRLFEREGRTPDIFTYLSKMDYHNRVIFQDSVLAIGIDVYLGADFSYYDFIALPMYLRERLESRFLPIDAMRAVIHYELEREPQPLQTLLDHMILNGKVAYFLEKTLPNVDMATRFGYTAEQMAWCRANEQMIWSYLVGEKLLYEQDSFKYRNFVLESPTVQIFPGSPGRIGHFLGYQIVRRYMRNTRQTFPELLAERDSQKILRASNYRP